MKQKLMIILAVAALVSSCLRDRFPDPHTGAGDNREVEIVLTSGGEAATRAGEEGTPEERVVQELDLLVFGSDGKFRLWRSAYRVNGKFRATLPVSIDIDVYFVANSRAIITALNDAGEFTADLTWNQTRLKLIDTDGGRFITDDTFVYLPMWGRLLKQSVEDVPVNLWPGVQMIRSVASVDIYVNDTATGFTMEDVYLYYVPDKGYLAPSAANYDFANKGVIKAESPSGMTTTLTLYSDRYDAATRSIANKLYLYDNDTDDDNRTELPVTTRRHTRIVVGGYYEGQKYWYPIDFETDDDRLAQVTRNWKYVYMINSVTSRGYEDLETAANEPMVGIGLEVVDWNVSGETDFWVSGPYYLGLVRRYSFVGRNALSSDLLPVRSNVPSDQVKLEFATAKNGTQVTTETGDVSNDRFRVEKVKDAAGQLTGLRVTALEAYNADDEKSNTDVVVLTAGRIRVEITITQQSGASVDWQWGGNIGDDEGVDLDK